MFTPGVRALGLVAMIDLRLRIAEFDAFTPDNDPYGDHGFGTVEVMGEKLFWKIDLYDRALKYGSDDPADPVQTHRVLTILFPSEY